MTNNPSQPITKPLSGRVLKYHSNLFTVEVQGSGRHIKPPTHYQCTLKGLLKKQETSVITGDYVLLDNLDPINRTARIIDVKPRQNQLPRPKIANVDQVIIVHPFREPNFDYEQLNRFLTHAALAEVNTMICMSKSDLGDETDPEGIRQEKQAIIALYETGLQIPVIFTSIHDATSLMALKEKIKGKISVLAGLSGAGKSSLLNRLNPDLKIKVQDVSEKIGRGTHTTRHVELIPLAGNILIADTPGFSNLKFDNTLPQDIEAAFPEFALYRSQCAFSNCLHLDETDCGVLKAITIDPASIHPLRYTSYQAIMAEALQYKAEHQSSSQKNEYGQKTLHAKGKETKQITRLKSKAREGSRRTLKQDLDAWVDEEDMNAKEDLDT